MNIFKILFAISMFGLTTYSYADNSDAAKLCQHGGWQNQRTATGGSFSNTGDCVSYAAHGGILFSPSISLAGAITCMPIPTMVIPGGTAISITIPFNASGYTPGSIASGALSGPTFATSTLTLTPQNFGAPGSINSGAISNGLATVQVSSSSASLSGDSLDMTISDSNNISTSITVSCP